MTTASHLFDLVAIGMFLAMAGAGIWLVATQDRMVWVDLIYDDAYYYLGVAKNIAEGKGSSFLPPFATNGYQPLWLILLAVSGVIFGTGETALSLQILCLTYAFCFFFFLAARRKFGLGWPAVLATLSFPGVMLFGMETVMLPVLLIFFFSEQSWRKRGAIASLIFLARLDALSIVVGRDLYRAIVKKEFDLKHWLILAPVVGIYFLVNLVIFGTAVPVSGLAKAVGNVQAENLLPALVYSRTSFSLLGCAAVLYLLSRLAARQPALKYEEEMASAVVALVMCATYYSVFSGWPVWPWYYWALMFFAFMLMCELAGALSGFRDFSKPWMLLLLLPLAYPVFISKTFTAARTVGDVLAPLAEVRSNSVVKQSFGRDNIGLIADLQARGVPSGTFFAMGDRAGSFGFFSQGQYKFFHTEGLVGSRQYVDVMKADQGHSFVARLPIDFLVVDREAYLEDAQIIGVAEPIQAMSSRIGPYLLCFRKSGMVSDTTRSAGTRRRVLIDFKSLTGCPSAMQQRFLQLRNIYGGLRYFSLPSEYTEGVYRFLVPASEAGKSKPLTSP